LLGFPCLVFHRCANISPCPIRSQRLLDHSFHRVLHVTKEMAK
uniref:Ovule protein n=1 Tax=Brugia timori TaxID=42155 RepID=A0A0R3R5T7_9BILA